MADDDENDAGSVLCAGSVLTLRSRSTIDPKASSAFDTAARSVLKVYERHRRSVRQLPTNYNAWINAICLTERYCPIQVREFGLDELRMRSCGVIGGSGYCIVFFDTQMGTVIKTAHDLTSPILCMSVTNPKRRSKLAPLLVAGLRDGRVILYDMQSAAPIYESISLIYHPAPITAVHICEGIRSLCAVATHTTPDRTMPQCLLYNFDQGRVEHTLTDHVEGSQITSITTCIVAFLHSLICTAGTDGSIFIYDIDTFARVLALRDNLVVDSRGWLVSKDDSQERPSVLAIACTPGHLAEKLKPAVKAARPARPSLLIAACRDSVLRVFDLNSGRLVHRLWGHDKGTQVLCVAGIATRTPGAVSGGEDGSVRVWDCWHGVQLCCFRDPLLYHSDMVRTIAVSLSPRVIIASGGYDSRTILWDLTTATYGPTGGDKAEPPPPPPSTSLEAPRSHSPKQKQPQKEKQQQKPRPSRQPPAAAPSNLKPGSSNSSSSNNSSGGGGHSSSATPVLPQNSHAAETLHQLPRSQMRCPALARAFRCLTRRPDIDPSSSGLAVLSPAPGVFTTLSVASFDESEEARRVVRSHYRRMCGSNWTWDGDGDDGEGEMAEEQGEEGAGKEEEAGQTAKTGTRRQAWGNDIDVEEGSVASLATDLEGKLGGALS